MRFRFRRPGLCESCQGAPPPPTPAPFLSKRRVSFCLGPALVAVVAVVVVVEVVVVVVEALFSVLWTHDAIGRNRIRLESSSLDEARRRTSDADDAGERRRRWERAAAPADTAGATRRLVGEPTEKLGTTRHHTAKPAIRVL